MDPAMERCEPNMGRMVEEVPEFRSSEVPACRSAGVLKYRVPR